MHQISEQTIETARKHAQKSVEHSKEIQELGKSLEKDSQIEPEQKKRIEALHERVG